MRKPSANPYATPTQIFGVSSGPNQRLRWEVAPATLSVSLGVVLFLMNCIHLLDAMIPEIRRALDSGNGFTLAHGLFCVIASSLFFGASLCAVLAAWFWMRTQYRTAVALDMCGVPSLLFLGVFLMYFQI